MTVAIVGVGETTPVWRDDRPVGALVVEATRRALGDAGLSGTDVDGFATEGYEVARDVPVDEISAAIGVRDRTFSASASLAGAGVVQSLRLAELAIESGLATTVVSYYGISLSSRTLGAYSFHAKEPLKAAFEMPFGYFGQPVYFAALAQRYAHEFGLASEELGSVAVAARAFAARTPGALRQHKPLDLATYLDDKIVADPLRRADCCVMNDGAAAFVITSLDRARDLAKPPVVVAGTGFGALPVTQAGYFTQNETFLDTGAVRSGPKAFAAAGLAPGDVDIAQIYDCFTISVILQLEDLGFACKGEGAAFAGSGAIGPDGALPVNTHGGLLANSYTVGAGHVVEAVRQLRGERGAGQVAGSEVALVAGLGSMDHATTLLTTDR
jgi:acetyl-CoA acetyltransferase